MMGPRVSSAPPAPSAGSRAETVSWHAFAKKNFDMVSYIPMSQAALIVHHINDDERQVVDDDSNERSSRRDVMTLLARASLAQPGSGPQNRTNKFALQARRKQRSLNMACGRRKARGPHLRTVDTVCMLRMAGPFERHSLQYTVLYTAQYTE